MRSPGAQIWVLIVDFEDEQEAPLLCGPVHSGPLSAGLDSFAEQKGWGAFLPDDATCHCSCHTDQVL